MSRSFPVWWNRTTVVTITCDASPWGYGAVLNLDGRPVEYIATPISEDDIQRLHVVVGDPKYQAFLETMSILIAMRTWLTKWAGQQLFVHVRSDAAAALGAIHKLKSKCPSINALVREIALDVAEGLYEVNLAEHLPGHENIWADSLSRLREPDTPKALPK